MPRTARSRAASQRPRRSRVQVRADVVIDQHEVVVLGALQHLEGLGRRQRGRRRVVQHRVDHVEARLVFDDHALERHHVGSVVQARDADHLGPVRGEQAEHQEPRCVVDQDGVTRRDEVARDQIEGLGRTTGVRVRVVDHPGSEQPAGHGPRSTFRSGPDVAASRGCHVRLHDPAPRCSSWPTRRRGSMTTLSTVAWMASLR